MADRRPGLLCRLAQIAPFAPDRRRRRFLVEQQLEALRESTYAELEAQYVHRRQAPRIASDRKGHRYEVQVSADRDDVCPAALRLVVTVTDLRGLRTVGAGIVMHDEAGVIGEVAILPFRTSETAY